MKPQFKRLMQIGIIVRDVEKAVQNYEAAGIGPWDVTVMRNDEPPFEDLTFNGQEIKEKGPIMKTAMMKAFGVEIELVEPIADTMYKEWLDTHGPGLHHIAVDLENDYYQALEEYQEKTGKEPWVRGQGVHGMMDFSYLDLREEMGVIVECYKKLQPGKPALPYDLEGEVTK